MPSIAKQSRLVHRRASFDIFRVYIRSAIDQEPDLRLIGDGPKERCRFPPGGGVDIGPVIDEKSHRRDGPVRGSVMQCRRTAGVLRGYELGIRRYEFLDMLQIALADGGD